MAYKIKNDSYQKARGGHTRMLDITCEHCGQHVCFYQKDGPGNLRRMYIDRIINGKPSKEQLICDNCKRVLGVKITYAKENRLAYRLFVDAVKKKIVNKKLVS